ncbi:hypothetical protein CDEF62S_01048 [Castellaniella defragrans]
MLANDHDIDAGDTLTVTGVEVTGGAAGTLGTALAGTYGSLVLNPDGSYTYQLDNTLAATRQLASGATATDSFTYTASDGRESVTQTLTVTVTGTNDVPVIDVAGSTISGAVTEAGGVGNGVAGTQTATGTVVATDVDAGDTLHWSIVGTPDATYGTFAIDAATGQWTYTLDDTKAATQALAAGDTQSLTYTVQVTDAHGATTTQDVKVTLTGSNDVPVVTHGTGAMAEDTRVDAGLLKVQGTAANGQALTIADVDHDQNTFDSSSVAFDGNSLGGMAALGQLTVNADGTWDYQIDNSLTEVQSLAVGETLTETFTVKSFDGTATSTVTVTITGTNDAPVANDDAVSGLEDTTITGNVINGTAPGEQADIDPDGDMLSVVRFSVDGHTYAAGATAILAGGLLTIDPDGSYVFKPEPNWNGPVPSVTYTVSDGHDGVAQATLTIEVNPVNDAPEAADKALTLTEDGAHVFAASDFGFSDPADGNGLQAVVIGSLPAAGALTLDGVAVTAGQSISATDLAAGKLVFTPAADANGTNYADFTFQVQDDGGTANGGADTSTAHTITVNVAPVQDVANDAAATNEDTAVVMDVLANDSFEGANKTVTAVNGAALHSGDTVNVAHGTVTLGADGKLTFTPDANWNGQRALPIRPRPIPAWPRRPPPR